MNKEQATSKLREICAEISNDRAQIQESLSRILLQNWQPGKAEAELYGTLRAHIKLLLTKTYDGKSFESGIASRAIVCILMCSGLLEALRNEEGKRRKLCTKQLH